MTDDNSAAQQPQAAATDAADDLPKGTEFFDDDGSSGDVVDADALEADDGSDEQAAADDGDADDAQAEEGTADDSEQDGQEAGEADSEVRGALPPEVQAQVDQIAAKITARYKGRLEEAEQRIAEQQARYDQLRQQAGIPDDVNPETGEPIVPDKLPDPFDADYEQQLRYREQQIRRHTQWQIDQQRHAEQMQAQAAQRAEAAQKAMPDYFARGKKMGFAEEEVKGAGAILMQSQALNEDLATDLLTSEDGPAVSVYLSRHQEHIAPLQALVAMGNTEGAREYIKTAVKPAALKAAQSRKKTPPPPTRTARGSGVRDDDMPPGAAFL
jgi:hypothetical protein